MDSRHGYYELLARVLTYPGRDYLEWVDRCENHLRQDHPDAAGLVRQFASQTRDLAIERLQELYTQTFDLNPVCSLEIGWQLYGEEYARGSFLVTMRQQLRRHGIPESTELPDHLTHVLPLLERMDEEEAGKFSSSFVIPALKKMLPSFEGKDSPYENILQALNGLLQAQMATTLAEVSHD